MLDVGSLDQRVRWRLSAARRRPTRSSRGRWMRCSVTCRLLRRGCSRYVDQGFPASLFLSRGPGDGPGLSFDEASMHCRDALVADHHFVVQCLRCMGNMVPPIMAPTGGGTRVRFLRRFFPDHPYGVASSDSPYLRPGLPPSSPVWCSLARPRHSFRKNAAPIFVTPLPLSWRNGSIRSSFQPLLFPARLRFDEAERE